MSMNAAIDEMGSNELDLPFKSATAVMKESDLSDTSRSIHIVTTASLPWMTGTAVNPLLRALYFQRTRSSCDARVTLVIPWVEKKLERNDVYQGKVKFSDGKVGRKEQEMFVRDWAANKAGMAEESKLIRIQFYPAKYRKKLGSILPMVDICSLIPANQADIAILEEPEHLNWLALPRYQKYSVNTTRHDDFMPSNDIGWMQKFKYVVGIIHTNYPAYAKSYGVRGSRTLTSKTILGLNILVCRSYCHKLVKLSATLPTMAKYKECVSNVHGVRADFLRAPSDAEIEDVDDGRAKAYFIGKILWAKGFDFLLHCQKKYHETTGDYFPIDIYGGGPDEEKIKRAFHGVRKQSSENFKNEEEVEAHEDSDEDSKGETDEHIESFRSKLYETMQEETNLNHQDRFSTVNTLKDGLKMMKRLPKETVQFDFSTLPKTRYEWRKKPIPARFVGPKDHAALKFSSHKVFVNPSVTEVLCTTSAEALAMGKFVILPRHPSNEFFYQFPNCLAYKDMDEFVSHMEYAMNNDPPELSPQLTHKFTWEAAMKRLEEAVAFTEEEYKSLQASGKVMKDRRKAWIHQESGRLIKGESLKNLIGGPPQEDLKYYEVDDDVTRSDNNEGGILSFENNNPKILALISFLIAILSYFAQR